MQTQEQTESQPPVRSPEPGLAAEFRAAWQQLPDKTMFFVLLAAWLALYHFLGNATLGYINTPSLLNWMFAAYTAKGPQADDGHGVLIPFVVAGLLWWKRKELLALPLRNWWPGLLLVGLALLLHLAGYAIQQPRVCIVALLGGLYALAGVVWGPAFLRASFFPFFLFAFMVPLGSLTEPVTFPLRLTVSKITAAVCDDALGMSVVREGTRLFSSAGLLNSNTRFEYEVAAACSGMRSLVAITAIGIIYAFMVFRTWSSRMLLMASAVPLAVIGNVFRMMTIVLAAEFGGQNWGNYVHEGGPLGILSLLPYVPAIIGLMLLGRWLEKMQDRNAKLASPTYGGGQAA